ncbi:unnamed protein product [Amoebophrya sp. A25]|nr:unnamed protein product [Amoebophrya sp. A25]|eukprot:GSA25T00014079001.1
MAYFRGGVITHLFLVVVTMLRDGVAASIFRSHQGHPAGARLLTAPRQLEMVSATRLDAHVQGEGKSVPGAGPRPHHDEYKKMIEDRSKSPTTTANEDQHKKLFRIRAEDVAMFDLLKSQNYDGGIEIPEPMTCPICLTVAREHQDGESTSLYYRHLCGHALCAKCKNKMFKNARKKAKDEGREAKRYGNGRSGNGIAVRTARTVYAAEQRCVVCRQGGRLEDLVPTQEQENLRKLLFMF